MAVTNAGLNSDPGPSGQREVAGVTAAIGDILVVAIATANSGEGGAPVGITVTDSAGNTYTQRSQVNRDPGNQNDGITLTIFTAKLTSTLSNGNIFAVFNPSVDQGSGMTVQRFAPGAGRTASYVSVGGGAAGESGSPTITSGILAEGDTIVGAIAVEGQMEVTGDSDTSNGNWSAQYGVTGGTGDARQVRTQNKTVTAGGAQTYNPTYDNADYAINYIVLRSSVVDLIAQSVGVARGLSVAGAGGEGIAGAGSASVTSGMGIARGIGVAGAGSEALEQGGEGRGIGESIGINEGVGVAEGIGGGASEGAVIGYITVAAAEGAGEDQRAYGPGSKPPWGDTIIFNSQSYPNYPHRQWDLIQDGDYSAFLRAVSKGKRKHEGYAEGSFRTVWVFEVAFKDSAHKVDVTVHQSYSAQEAEFEAGRIYPRLGKLPKIMRENLSFIYVNNDSVVTAQGDDIQHSISLYPGRITERISQKLFEETFFHEAVHAVLQQHTIAGQWNPSDQPVPQTMGIAGLYSAWGYTGNGKFFQTVQPDWLKAVKEDNAFISWDGLNQFKESKYYGEDYAETAMVAYPLKFYPDRFTAAERKIIRTQVPNRIAYFNNLFATYGIKPPGFP